MRRILFIISVIYSLNAVYANEIYDEIKQDPNKAGGVYFAYPDTCYNVTPAPSGYKPFYISHIGRHGSRFLLKESDYTLPLKTLELAHGSNALTLKGEGVFEELTKLYDLAKLRAGDLTEKGVRQHKHIAARMFDAYPEVFSGNNVITAHSTMVMRCAMSMAAFTESLKEKNPDLRVVREPSERNAKYINNPTPELAEYNRADGRWQTEYKELRNSTTPYERIIPEIFSDAAFIEEHVKPVNFTCQLYNVFAGMQNLDVENGFMNLFTDEELYKLWKIYNFRMYVHCSNCAYSNGVVLQNCIPLLNDMIERADAAIADKRIGADLRFGHDLNIIPMTALLGFDGCNHVVSDPEEICEVFQDYKISPMASNIQMIFFRNEAEDVLVKFLLNEREISIPCKTDSFPFYRWPEVRSYLLGRLTNYTTESR